MREPAKLKVFVYGTLKKGQRNHEHFCRGFASAREATVRGRLYDLPYGFPALIIPREDVLITGTTDYLSDAEEGHHAEAVPQEPSPAWDKVHGELFTFGDPGGRLQALDGLEGFTPGEKGLYKRVLIPAMVPTGVVVPAWTYIIESESGSYLPGGRWPV